MLKPSWCVLLSKRCSFRPAFLTRVPAIWAFTPLSWFESLLCLQCGFPFLSLYSNTTKKGHRHTRSYFSALPFYKSTYTTPEPWRQTRMAQIYHMAHHCRTLYSLLPITIAFLPRAPQSSPLSTLLTLLPGDPVGIMCNCLLGGDLSTDGNTHTFTRRHTKSHSQMRKTQPRHKHPHAFCTNTSLQYAAVVIQCFPHVNLFVVVRHNINIGRHTLIFYFSSCMSHSPRECTAQCYILRYGEWRCSF